MYHTTRRQTHTPSYPNTTTHAKLLHTIFASQNPPTTIRTSKHTPTQTHVVGLGCLLRVGESFSWRLFLVGVLCCLLCCLFVCCVLCVVCCKVVVLLLLLLSSFALFIAVSQTFSMFHTFYGLCVLCVCMLFCVHTYCICCCCFVFVCGCVVMGMVVDPKRVKRETNNTTQHTTTPQHITPHQSKTTTSTETLSNSKQTTQTHLLCRCVFAGSDGCRWILGCKYCWRSLACVVVFG